MSLSRPRVFSPSALWRAALVALAAADGLGCTRILGIDGEYMKATVDGGNGGSRAGAGGSSAGASGAGAGGVSTPGDSSTLGSGGLVTGGTASSGGSVMMDGAAGRWSCADTSECPAESKCCNGACVTPSSAVGCTLTDCTPCPEPLPNAEVFCAAPSSDAQPSECSARCSPGYVPGAGACVPEGSIDAGDGGTAGAGGTTGGSGGVTGGTGGMMPCMTVDNCPPCTNPAAGPLVCCDVFLHVCGCTWFPAYCVQPR